MVVVGIVLDKEERKQTLLVYNYNSQEKE